MFDMVCEVPEFISSSLSLCLLSLTRFPASLFGWPLLQLFDNLYFSSSSFIIDQLIVALLYQGIFKNLIFVCVSTELDQLYKECPIHFKNHNKEAITGGIVLDLTAQNKDTLIFLSIFCFSNMKI